MARRAGSAIAALLASWASSTAVWGAPRNGPNGQPLAKLVAPIERQREGASEKLVLTLDRTPRDAPALSESPGGVVLELPGVELRPEDLGAANASLSLLAAKKGRARIEIRADSRPAMVSVHEDREPPRVVLTLLARVDALTAGPEDRDQREVVGSRPPERPAPTCSSELEACTVNEIGISPEQDRLEGGSTAALPYAAGHLAARAQEAAGNADITQQNPHEGAAPVLVAGLGTEPGATSSTSLRLPHEHPGDGSVGWTPRDPTSSRDAPGPSEGPGVELAQIALNGASPSPPEPAAASGPTFLVPPPPPVGPPAPAGHPSASAAAGARAGEPAGLAGCRWVRVEDLMLCGPDPSAPRWSESTARMAMVARVLAGSSTPVKDAESNTPEAAFLAADGLAVGGARRHGLLGAVDAYRRAIRRFPDDPEAARARWNIALAYRAMGFWPELQDELPAMERSGLTEEAQALAGERELARDRLEDAAGHLARVSERSLPAYCLARRAEAELARREDDAVRMREKLALIETRCPRSFATDPETVRLTALAVAAAVPREAGDTPALVSSRAMLRRLQSEVGPAGKALLIEDLAAAQARVRDYDGAEKSWRELESRTGSVGARQRATVGLARVDLAKGRTEAALARLDQLGHARAAVERRVLLAEVMREALSEGDAPGAVALAHEGRVDPATLTLPERVALAASHRRVGLYEEARDQLDAIALESRGDAPDVWWQERAELAREEGDATVALQIAREWRRRRGLTPPVEAAVAEALALGASGESSAAREVLEREVAPRDAGAAERAHAVLARRGPQGPATPGHDATASAFGPGTGSTGAAHAVEPHGQPSDDLGKRLAAVAQRMDDLMARRIAGPPATEGKR